MNAIEQDKVFMHRCLELASLGAPWVSPNPMVGCVVVCNDKIIGEGYHQKFGDKHAEVVAIDSVKDKSLLSKSTLYVNLEPCAHYGKTPPCANLILKHKIKRVVCAMADPNPLVTGNGIQLLRDAGIDVLTKVLIGDALELNKAFVSFHSKKRPYLILKWAKTADGFIGRTIDQNHLSKKISGTLANMWVHKLRANSSAILVGANTVIEDNPSLTTRLISGPNPTRFVIDLSGKIPPDAKIFTDNLATVVFGKCKVIQPNITVVPVSLTDNAIEKMLEWCMKNNCIQILIEGGTTTLNRFIEQNYWDEAFEIISEVNWEKGILAPTMAQKPIKVFKLGDDSVACYKNGSQ